MGDRVVSRAGAFVVAAFSVTAAGVACSTILGIEDLPLRDAGADAAVDAPSADAAEEPEACSTSLLQGCAASCPHFFCDDFDLENETPNTKWPGTAFIGSPFVKGNGSVLIGDAGSSPPSSLYAVSHGKDGGSTYGFLANVLEAPDGGVPGVLSLAFDVNLETVTFSEARGPVPDAGNASVAAIVLVDKPPAGIAVVVNSNAVRLAVSDDITEGSAPTSLDFIWNGALSQFFGDWVRIKVLVTTAARAIEMGYDTCKGKTGPVAVGVLAEGVNPAACVPLTSKLADLTKWAYKPGILVGSLLFGNGNIAVRLDNVTADFLP